MQQYFRLCSTKQYRIEHRLSRGCHSFAHVLLIAITTLFTGVVAADAKEVALDTLVPTKEHRQATEGILQLMQQYHYKPCLLYTSPSPRDATLSRMPSSA